jgi:Na+:H+ antiporter
MGGSVYTIVFQIALLLFAAKVFGELASRLSFPSVLGEIIAGILLGPSVLNWVRPSLSTNAIATIGIILLLFMAGLEIDIDLLKKTGVAAFVVASLGVMVPMIGGALAFSALGKSLHTAIFIGAIMTATSIGLTLRTLLDIGKFRTRAGTTIVGAAVIDDVIGIFILTILVSVEVGHKHISALYILRLGGLVLLFFVLSLALGWWLAKYVARFVARMRVEEALLALSICAALGLAWAASNFQVAEITGAFVAGLIFNRTPEQHVIAEKINVVGYGIFIPVFFAYIGVNTDLSALGKAGYPVLVFLGIAIFGKIIGCGIAARFWFKTKESVAIGVGMIPRAEVALIMATLGLHSGIIDSTIFSMTVVTVFVTNILTPILLRLAFGWESTSSKK